jgi:hypothetical protein
MVDEGGNVPDRALDVGEYLADDATGIFLIEGLLFLAALAFPGGQLARSARRVPPGRASILPMMVAALLFGAGR